jgi:hypothetical protein
VEESTIRYWVHLNYIPHIKFQNLVRYRTVGEILGHKTAAMTERYAHLTPEHKRKAVECLPDWEAGEKDSHKMVTK